MLDQANVPIESIQRILGHENWFTTEIYLHVISDSERLAMDAFDKNLGCFFHTKEKDQQSESSKSWI